MALAKNKIAKLVQQNVSQSLHVAADKKLFLSFVWAFQLIFETDSQVGELWKLVSFKARRQSWNLITPRSIAHMKAYQKKEKHKTVFFKQAKSYWH